MALNEQVYVYMVDTSAFYLEDERQINSALNELYLNRSNLKKQIKKIETKVLNEKASDKEKIELDNKKQTLSEITQQINIFKKDLLKTLDENLNKTRLLNPEYLKPKNVVGIFSSNTTRTIGMKINELSMDMIIMQVYYFSVLESTIRNGFNYINTETGEVIKYICYTASAGQIRQKKLVFMKEDLYKKYSPTLMCGLTVDVINSKGGCNTNKFLAYTALNNSATDVWNEFDIKKTIVVNDMEFDVSGIVDFIDYQTFEITRKQMDVPVPHTDGAGLMLYKKFKKAHMVRLPFVKGLLVPFPFDKFILEQRGKTGDNSIGVIKDIYGIEHDIIAEEIEVIFTKSQTKMWKYYKDWQEYQENFIKYNCKAGICNQEEDDIIENTVSYQMLQTLTDVKDDELLQLCKNTKDEIVKIGNNRETMLSILGATKANNNKNPYQKSLYLYPELLKDVYSKEVLKNKKRKLLRNGYAGKINLGGKYTFVMPDMYAFCEFLFLGIEKPKGLLNNNEISCRIFENNIEIDCLRSPHIYREHAIRTNVVNESTKKWFVTNGAYTSTQDLITKLLQMDVDGDTIILVTDPLFIKIVKRNIDNDKIVPLYYEMKSAAPSIINWHSIYTGLQTAYISGNIGAISNSATKIWNDPNPDIECIKYLCMLNNFTIDEAKTLYTLKLPHFVINRLKRFTKQKVPKFFEYAKDKDTLQVEERNNSTVNRLYNMIGSPKLNFKSARLGNFDFTMLLHNRHFTYDENDILHKAIIEDYDSYNKYKKFRISHESHDYNNANKSIYYYDCIRKDLIKEYKDPYFICDVLTYYLYKTINSRFKLTLWSSFGEILYENLYNNLLEIKKKDTENSFNLALRDIDDVYFICNVCGGRFLRKENADKRNLYCNNCAKEIQLQQIKKHKERNKKGYSNGICENCGCEFKRTSNRQRYCNYCQKDMKKLRDRNYYRK